MYAYIKRGSIRRERSRYFRGESLHIYFFKDFVRIIYKVITADQLSYSSWEYYEDFKLAHILEIHQQPFY